MMNCKVLSSYDLPSGLDSKMFTGLPREFWDCMGISLLPWLCNRRAAYFCLVPAASLKVSHQKGRESSQSTEQIQETHPSFKPTHPSWEGTGIPGH